MSQPKWKYVTNFGDVNPLDHEGCFLFIDETGVYPPEIEKLSIDNPEQIDEDKLKYTIYRVVCEPCTFENGILSDNKYHKDHPAWWASKNKDPKHGHGQWNSFCDLAKGIQQYPEEYAKEFTSGDSEILGNAYYTLCENFGWGQFDQYPIKMNRKEVEERYKRIGI